MLTAVVFLLILTTAVVIHELAHYWNAKSVGLPVKSFSVGMGPVLLRKHWRGTEWRLSLLPIGGYVDIPGMAPKQDEQGNYQHPDEGFATKNVWQKIWVLIGGVIANFILAVVLLAVVITADPSFRTLTSGIQSDFGAKIAAVEPGMSAAELGIQANDVILKIHDIEDPRASQVTDAIRSTTGTLTLLLGRNGEEVTISTPWPPENLGSEPPRLGIQIEPLSVETPPSINFFGAMAEATTFYVSVVPESLRGFVRGIGQAATGQQNSDVAGVVGIVDAVNQATKIGIIPVIALAAFINFSLALFNLLPIPGLDGGRILLAGIVALRGKPFKPGQEEFIHFVGFMSVLAIMLLITFNEVTGLFRN
ncbi:MAG: M50 family metallopeptidase [Trueperaceae bacterium]